MNGQEDVTDSLARSFLGKLPPDVIEQLLTKGECADFPAGSSLYREGGVPRAALIVQGLIRVYMTSPEGRQVTIPYARDADVLGIALVVGGPVNVSVQTIAPSTLFGISSRTIMRAARDDARVAWAVAEEVNRRLYEQLQQTAINAFGSVKQRVATHLLDLASSQQRPKGRLVAHVSQQGLADAAGSVREVVARVLRELRGLGSGRHLARPHPDSRRGPAPR